jgi:energy-coupling factor transport system permease protein
MGKRTFLLELRFRKRDVVFSAVVLTLAVLSIYLRLIGYGTVFPEVI